MKKYLIILIISILNINSYGQSLRKKINFIEEKSHSIKLVRPISGERIVCVIESDNYFRVYLYDKEFNELGMNEIPKQEKKYLYKVRLKDDFLYISNAVSGYNGLSLKTISLDTDFKTNDKIIEEDMSVGDYHISSSREKIFYSVSGKNFYQLNNNSNKVVWIDPKLEKKEKMFVNEFQTFKENNILAIVRNKSKGMTREREIILYDENRTELLLISKLENNKYKSNVYFTANDSDIYCLGNYEENPNEKKVAYGTNPLNNTGIYIKNTSKNKSYEKFYKYSDFKNFSIKIDADKETKKLTKFNVELEKIAFLKNENIAFCTIYKDIESLEYSQRYGELRSDDVGIERKYILIFGFNNSGELLWDKVIPLNKNLLVSNDKDDMFEDNFLTVKEVENSLKCHYSFNDKINYFELNNGQIINKKETSYVEVPNVKYEIGYQYKDSNHWYDNYYISWCKFDKDDSKKSDNWVCFDKIEFNK
jgi:hypothetical protein